MNPFHREPAFFTTTNAEQIGYNKPDREGVVMRNGEAVRVKHPQSGHQGDYDSLVRMKGEGTRWWTVVKSDGSIVYYVLTNGAGDMNPNTEYALDRKQKAKFYGWFRLGQCPVALLRAGEMHKGHFAPVRALNADGSPKVDSQGKPVFEESSLLAANPCQPGTYSLDRPCPHALAEAKARSERNTVKEAESAQAHADKREAAQREQTTAITEAMGKQTDALMASNREAIAMIATALGAKPEPTDDPPKGKRG